VYISHLEALILIWFHHKWSIPCHPRMTQNLRYRNPFLWVSHKNLSDQIFIVIR
jgi:hypothetical protein